MSKRKRIYRGILIILVFFDLMFILDMGIKEMASNIPSNIRVLVGTEEIFDFGLPVEGDIETKQVGVFHVDQKENVDQKIHINLNKPFSIQSNQVGAYKVELKLFGKFTLKQINIDVIESLEVVPSGMPIGIYVNTDGVLVLGTGEVTDCNGGKYEPAWNILKSGDYIVAINGQNVSTIKQVINCVDESKGRSLTFTVRRNEEEIQLKVEPVKNAEGEYKIGVWIREDTQGIGTLTYITTDGKFGALGHPITDMDTGTLLEIKEGSIYTTQILDIVKGKSGEPGEILGVVNQNTNNRIGSVSTNTKQGIYGSVDREEKIQSCGEVMEIGLKQDIKLGKAYIRCMIENELRDYEIEIVKINLNPSAENKGMVIKITDERLLALTNGIIQGMSGSPIIQDDKFIGAVTHVFIQDSTKGYGTFIENMIINSK
ncbi:SpoIVB peptidase [Anaerosporobacter faecicola]|uniref:SpoIVB peptidase n=1 Tax=Anaerosporobacter faecicola TaxID=2718714 RepID=UPI00143C3D80|nr:SpoIVB peptidase [Anaerosporobacter faecicola]